MEERASRRQVSLRDDVERTGRGSLSRSAHDTRGRGPIRTIIITLVLLAALLAAALVGFIVLSNMPVFTITSIDTADTEHLTKENIAKLADVPEGTTLLTIDEVAVSENLMRNPWGKEVSFAREFPDKLQISVTERVVGCLVKMSTGSVCWLLGDDNVWIEPVNLTVKDGQSADDAALALAQEMGAVLVTDVPMSMSPTAGSAAADDELKAVSAYQEQFSEAFAAQIVRFSAAGPESISCTLKSGVEVSLGMPTNIDLKEEVITSILERHPSQITYINVRVPSQPSYRRLGVETVTDGTGIELDGVAGTDVQQTGTDSQDGQNGQGSQGTPGTSQTQEGTDAAATDAEGQPTSGDAAAQGENSSQPEDGWSEGQDSWSESDGSEGQDTSEMILGEDGIWYTYEDYWGLS